MPFGHLAAFYFFRKRRGTDGLVVPSYRRFVRSRVGDRFKIYGRVYAPLAVCRHDCRDGGELLFLSMATKTLPIGTAYAVWTGIGALGAVIIGMLFLNEPVTVPRIIFLLFILVGLIGLKLTSGQ